MIMNTVEQFIERVNQDAGLQARIKDASVETVVSIAHDLGYAFSAEQFRAATESLSEDDLGNITGGATGSFLWVATLNG